MLQAVKNYYHLIQGFVAVNKYGRPAAGMTVIGVTGTDGKTTTASLIYHILRETGHKAALISTVAAYIGDRKFDTGFHVSTPHSSELQSYIAQAKRAGIKFLVLEVTSHAIDQYRIYGIPFKVGVLTNVSREHLDYHKTMLRYMATKARLLQHSQVAIINKDDSSYKFMAERLKGRNILTYGLKDAAVTISNHPFTSKLFGKFNTYNTLAALAVCDALNIDAKLAAKAVQTYTLPEGRCEIVYQKDFTVIVDFAHTPNGIKSILEAINEEKKKGKIIHVFGSAGRRDKGKRALMGEVSDSLADMIILTSEDPRDEPPESIAEDILSGMRRDRVDVLVIPDRQKAITKAISLAKSGDFVILTGKGHEKSMNMGDGEQQWSDSEAVKRALEMRHQTEDVRNKK